jgi:hypothetical protein
MKFYYYDEGLRERLGENTDISGKEYISLIDSCFRYSAFFSFRRYQHSILDWTPEPASFPNENDLCFVSMLSEKSVDLLYVFRCNERTKGFLKSYTKGLQYWYDQQMVYGPLNMPEDLCFYRADGSVLFCSQTHEGDIWLFLNDDEDFSSNTSQSGWSESPRCDSNLLDPKWLFTKTIVHRGPAFDKIPVKHGK